MMHLRPLLFPVSAAWFIGILWWVAQREQRAFDQASAEVNGAYAAASLMHFGPLPVEAITARVELEPILISFVKNEEGAGLSAEVLQQIDAFKQVLEAEPEAMVTILGHTDADGDPDLNIRLSNERAEAVKAQLVEQGIAEDRMRTMGMGAALPIADNYTSKGKAQNRRVEVKLDRPTP